MNGIKVAALALIVAGALALAYGGFTYTKEKHQTKIGPLEISTTDKETVNIPMWAGIAAIAIGAGLLVFGGKKG